MAGGCELDKYVGREVAAEFFIGCGDVRPAPGDWLPIGSLRDKGLSTEWDTVDATADDSLGSFRANLATYQTLSLSVSGVCKRADGTASNQTALTKHVFIPSLTGGQPVAWFRLTYPDITVEAFMLISSLERTGTYDDLVTFSLEASVTESPLGVFIEDTPVV